MSNKQLKLTETMEKRIYLNTTLKVETRTEMHNNSTQLGWLTRGAASDFHFEQKRAEWLGKRRSHTLHRRDGVNISRHDEGRFRITITLESHTSAEDINRELFEKASQAANFFNKQ
jgi:hypothetical protein